MASSTNSDDLLVDLTPLLREYKDGRVQRLMESGFVPAGLDPETGVQSKDVVISAELNLSGRLYLPAKIDSSGVNKLPLLVYFHGGGFLVESAFYALYQNHLNHLVAEANVVAVSVNYRLAPENPLPAAFEDSWLSLKWVASQFSDEGRESWIKEHGDKNRVFLGGDSAGGTIAHNVAVRAGVEKIEGVSLLGIFLNCPFFWGEIILNDYELKHPLYPKSFVDKLWLYANPKTAKGCDDPDINPAMDPNLSSLGCKRILVYVAEKDVLRGRGLLYPETLRKASWDGDVEVVDVAGEDHVFSVLCPTGENGAAMLKKVSSFVNQ